MWSVNKYLIIEKGENMNVIETKEQLKTLKDLLVNALAQMEALEDEVGLLANNLLISEREKSYVAEKTGL